MDSGFSAVSLEQSLAPGVRYYYQSPFADEEAEWRG